MLYPIDQIINHLQTPRDSLDYHILQTQLETNRLLGLLINGNKQETETIKVTDYTSMKRPEIMKTMGKTKAPQGWQKWSNEKMLNYLKEVI